MILNNFSKEDILYNVAKVVAEFSSSSIPGGLTLKYAKQLKNRAIPDNTILGVHHYTIQGNTVYVVATKRLFYRSPRKAGELTYTYYISVLNSTTGKYSYVRPNWDITNTHMTGYILFTAHFIQRLKERAGITFPELLKTNPGRCTPLADMEGENKVQTVWGTYRLFGSVDGACVNIATMVTDDMLYDDQLPVEDEFDAMIAGYVKDQKRFYAAA